MEHQEAVVLWYVLDLAYHHLRDLLELALPHWLVFRV